MAGNGDWLGTVVAIRSNATEVFRLSAEVARVSMS